ncbi:cysteine hydrolase family protein [Clostridium thermosuccinogenes]|mgnify:CR=1 FL=1|jgi:nicotinamidase-related amidase|uniref:cysteine hydrolase family protein n=1 Tax=Clostridium thermosuccinogenes TaxID=84032 RepID=UPI000CCC0324|nr:isochorismatase family cysteine hydrolase [Pseudoclostridium thermosuccinogenes]PNT94261.1 isochorismatase [Pseudoclostridium thermosuccinogenes]
MKLTIKNDFLNRSVKTLGEIHDMLEKLPTVELRDLQANQAALVIVDMINGFVREGALKSPRIEELIPEIVELSKMCDKLGIAKIAFADCHTEISPEFDSYPPHCMTGTHESEIVDEIKEVGGYTLIPKNSTNGFLEEGFQKWLSENRHINTFIITGDCTDICVQQFSITLKTWFNKQNMKSRIIVPVNAVETYDLGVHDADLVNVMALYNMMINGVEVVKSIV